MEGVHHLSKVMQPKRHHLFMASPFQNLSLRMQQCPKDATQFKLLTKTLLLSNIWSLLNTRRDFQGEKSTSLFVDKHLVQENLSRSKPRWMDEECANWNTTPKTVDLRLNLRRCSDLTLRVNLLHLRAVLTISASCWFLLQILNYIIQRAGVRVLS